MIRFLCTRCGKLKDESEFGVNSRRANGRSQYCKDCYRRMHAHYREMAAAKAGRTLRKRKGAPPGKKWCPDCGEFLDLSAFGRNRRTKSGLATYCKKCATRRSKESRLRVHGDTRHYHLVLRYGIGAHEVDAMVELQGGVCLICSRPLDGKAHVDHDHVTGVVRGILCFNCNGGLGQFGDDPARLRAALAYLRDAADRQAVPGGEASDAEAPDNYVAPVIDIYPPAYAESDAVRWHTPAPVVVEYTYRHAHPA